MERIGHRAAAAACIYFMNLQPGETLRTVTQLGQSAPEEVTAAAVKYRDEKQVDAAFAQHLSGRVHDIMELFVWPAVQPAPQFADR